MPYKYNPFSGNLDFAIGPGMSTAVIQVDTDAGSATPDAMGVLTVAGGTGFNTAGAGNTVTLNIDSPVTVANGGTERSSLTNGAILVGDAANPVELIGPLTDGQLLIGDTAGVSPVAASLTAPAAGFSISGGAGSITFALTDDLAALEALATTGLATRTAADTWTTRSVAVTASTGLSVSNGDGVAGNPTLAGLDATSSVKGVATFDENDFLVNSGDVTLAERTRLKSPYVENLGIDYNAGTGVFSIQGAQAALSATNPGYVGIPSKADPGEINVYEITADQNFIDDVGASEIIGNLFGLTTSIAYAQDLPFFIYAVVNDDEDAVAFMISRIPHATSSPAAANIGAPDDAVADATTDFWSLENIDETLYDSNPCVCIGSFRMQMSASDDWTVQTLDNFDGIMKFQEGRLFTLATGQFGAAAGGYIKDNGGTAPVFSTNNYNYSIDRNGYFKATISLDGDGGTDGSGAVTTFLAQPFNPFFSGGYYGSGHFSTSSASSVCQFSCGTSGCAVVYQSTIVAAVAILVHSSFANGNRSINGTIDFFVATS